MNPAAPPWTPVLPGPAEKDHGVQGSTLNPAAPEFIPASFAAPPSRNQEWASAASTCTVLQAPQAWCGFAHGDWGPGAGSSMGGGGHLSEVLRLVRTQENHAASCIQRGWRKWMLRRWPLLPRRATRSFRDAVLTGCSGDSSSSKARPASSGRGRARSVSTPGKQKVEISGAPQQHGQPKQWGPQSRRGEFSMTGAASRRYTARSGPPAKTRLSLLGQQHTGVVTRVEPAQGFAWIESNDVERLTGDVVFVDRAMLKQTHLQVGDRVTFRAELRSGGQPYAHEISIIQERSGHDVVEEEPTLEQLLKSELKGTVVEVHSDKGHGFLNHKGVKQLTGYDARFDLAQYPGINVGDVVRFWLGLDHMGHPQATKAGYKGVAGGSTSVLPSMTREELLTKVHDGEVAQYFAKKGHGFIRHLVVSRMLGKDVLFRGVDFPHARNEGDPIRFCISYDQDGKLRARDPTSMVDFSAVDSISGPRQKSRPRGLSRSASRGRRRRPTSTPPVVKARDTVFTLERLLAEEHEGIIKEFHEDRGYGFVKNKDIHSLCGHDVFFLKGQLQNCKPGMRTNFRVELDTGGRPRVQDTCNIDLRADDGETQEPLSLEECLDSVHEGVIADFDPNRARGFVRNKRIHCLFGKDVLFHKNQFPGKGIGDRVSFGVELDLDGRPRAKDPSEVLSNPVDKSSSSQCEPGKGRMSGTGSPGSLTKLLAQCHEGVIYQFNESQGYGFVRNADVYRLCGRDAFISASQFAGHEVGDRVSFFLELTNDGLPRVRDIRTGTGSAVEEPFTTEVMLSREQEGVIVEFDQVRQHGFIRNRQIHKLCGKDVLFRDGAFPGKGLGDVVRFRVALDATGKPRIRESTDSASHHGSKTKSDADNGPRLSVDLLCQGEHEGVVKEYFRSKGYGFVTSQMIQRLLGKDLFFRGGAEEEVIVGSHVRFRALRDADGRLKASIVGQQRQPQIASPAHHGFDQRVAGVSAAPMASSVPSSLSKEQMLSEEHHGTIAEFHPDHRYGFIVHEGIRRLTGRDIFITQAQFAGHAVGDEVFFTVELSPDGHPRAKSIAGPAVSKVAFGLKILVPDPMAAAIIGRKGVGISSLQNETGTQLNLTGRGNCYPGTSCRVLTAIAENEDPLQEALHQLVTIIGASEAERAKAASNPAAATNLMQSYALHLQVLIPMGALTDIKGMDDLGLQQLHDATGATAEIGEHSATSHCNEDCVVSLSGDVAALRAAVAWVSRRVQRQSFEPWFSQWAHCTSTLADVNMKQGSGSSRSRSKGGVWRPAPITHTESSKPSAADYYGTCTTSWGTSAGRDGDGRVHEDGDDYNVMLGNDFGPMGLRFRAGYRPEVESMRVEVRDFWERQHGLCIGDRLVKVNGRLVEGRPPLEVLEELARRPVLLTFSHAPKVVSQGTEKQVLDPVSSNCANSRGPPEAAHQHRQQATSATWRGNWWMDGRHEDWDCVDWRDRSWSGRGWMSNSTHAAKTFHGDATNWRGHKTAGDQHGLRQEVCESGPDADHTGQLSDETPIPAFHYSDKPSRGHSHSEHMPTPTFDRGDAAGLEFSDHLGGSTAPASYVPQESSSALEPRHTGTANDGDSPHKPVQ